MVRHAFYSFHCKPDCQRAALIRSMGVVDGNQPANDNDWEAVTKKGDQAIKNWIDGQIDGKSCSVVLIGACTAGRKWIKYEIEKSWNDKKGVLGIYIHRLKNLAGETSSKGTNPFDPFTVCEGKKKLSSVVKIYDPPYTESKDVYAYIKKNLADWIEDAITIRNDFRC